MICAACGIPIEPMDGTTSIGTSVYHATRQGCITAARADERRRAAEMLEAMSRDAGYRHCDEAESELADAARKILEAD